MSVVLSIILRSTFLFFQAVMKSVIEMLFEDFKYVNKELMATSLSILMSIKTQQ